MPVNEKPEMKQVVSSNGERACRYQSHGRQTRSAYIFSVSNTDKAFRSFIVTMHDETIPGSRIFA